MPCGKPRGMRRRVDAKSRGIAMEVVIVYVGLCFLIAWIGVDRKFGFWGYFFCSLFLTPFIGALVLLASDKRPKQPKVCPKCSYPIAETKTEKCLPSRKEITS